MKDVFLTEITNNFKKGFLFIILFLLVIQGIIATLSIEKYKENLKGQSDFIASETKVVNFLINYTAYLTYGFRVMMKPSAVLPLYENNVPFSNDLVGTIDTGARLRLDEPRIGPEIFKNCSGGALDYSWCTLVIISLPLMVWSFFAFRKKSYLRFLTNFKPYKRVYLGIMAARIFYLFSFLLISFILINSLFLIYGIRLTLREFLFLSLFYFLLFLFYSTLSMIMAAIGSHFNFIKGILIIFFIWFIFILLWPGILDFLISKAANRSIKKYYTIELKKLEILHYFETEVKKYSLQFSNLEDQARAKKYFVYKNWEEYIRQMDSVDNEVLTNTRLMASKYNMISLFNPITFIKGTGSEISGSGYRAYIDLQSGNKEKRKRFFKFIMERRFDKKIKKVEPFIPPKDALIQSSPHLPYYFNYGLLIQFIYLTLAFLFSFYVVKLDMKRGFISTRVFRAAKLEKIAHRLFKQKRKSVDRLISILSREIIFGNPKVKTKERNIVNLVDYNENKFYFLLTQSKAVENSLFYKLSNFSKDFAFVPSINDIAEDLLINEIFKTFSVPIPEYFLDKKDKLFGDLEKDNKARLILELAKHAKSDYLIFERFYMELSEAFINYFAEAILEMRKGRKIIYVASTARDITSRMAPYIVKTPAPVNW